MQVSKRTRTLIIIMGVLALSSFLVSKWYYAGQNRWVDPRVVDARQMYEQYNRYAESGKVDSIFHLMDTLEQVYTAIPHYRKSYEIGVLYNNRAAAWLTEAIYHATDTAVKDSLAGLAGDAARKSIQIYKKWKAAYGGRDEEELAALLAEDFMEGFPDIEEGEEEKYKTQRMKELQEAQVEIDRRISVSLTNLGIYHRHFNAYDSAANCYREALELWDRNLAAENNLNLLLGRPVKKQNAIQKLFPKERL